MAQQTKAYLKTRFSVGKKPTEQDFVDLIDSLVHVSDIEAVNAGNIDARINAYDTAQKTISGSETVTTVGDALSVLSALNPLSNVKQMIDEAGGEISWGSITDKPDEALVTWEEYTFTLDLYVQPPISSYESITATRMVEDNMPAAIKAAVGNKKWQILDMSFTLVPMRMSEPPLAYQVTRLRSVKIGVNPRIAFPE